MDTTNVPSNFRISLQVIRDSCSDFKCFILIDFNKMKYIRDVEEHIESVLNIKPISVFVDDVWLPSNETALIINQNDNLVAKVESVGSFLEELAGEKNAKKKKKKRTRDPLDYSIDESHVEKKAKENKKKKATDALDSYTGELITLEHCFKELMEKQLALKDTAHKSSTVDQNDDSDLLVFQTNDVKKKRIRKRKRKSTLNNVKPPVERTTTATFAKPSIVPFEGRYKRFDLEVPKNPDIEIKPGVENKLDEGSANNALERSDLDECNDLIPNERIEMNSTAKTSFTDEGLVLNLNVNGVMKEADINTDTNGTTAKIQDTQCDDLSTAQVDDKTDSEDWKSHLLNLANSKSVETKIFHRKLSVQETAASTEPNNVT